MNTKRSSLPDKFTPAQEAIHIMLVQELSRLLAAGTMEAYCAHGEIEQSPVSRKTRSFYGHFFPWRKNLVTLLTSGYRQLFKLGEAHPQQTGRDSHNWAWDQLKTAIGLVPEWIRDWYILACDGANQYSQPVGRAEFLRGQTVSIPLGVQPLPPPASWRAPAWLFQVSLPIAGVGPLKSDHVPLTDSEQKLGAAHTRLLLTGARRVFLWELAAAVERARNEETAAAGAIPEETVNTRKRKPINRRGWEQREKLFEAIRQILNKNHELEGLAFCAALDTRHAPPLFDWVKRNDWCEGLTWKEAWGDKGLKRKIRRVRQEAMKNR